MGAMCLHIVVNGKKQIYDFNTITPPGVLASSPLTGIKVLRREGFGTFVAVFNLRITDEVARRQEAELFLLGRAATTGVISVLPGHQLFPYLLRALAALGLITRKVLQANMGAHLRADQQAECGRELAVIQEVLSKADIVLNQKQKAKLAAFARRSTALSTPSSKAVNNND